MTALLHLSRWIDALNGWVGRAVSWLILIMTLVSAFNAVSRKVFNLSSNAFLEVQWYLFAAVFLLAAGYTLRHDGHVRIDLITGRLAPRIRLWIDLFATLVFLFPFTLLVLALGWPYFMDAVVNREVSLNAGGLWVAPARLLIPLGFALLFLQGVSQLIKLIAALSYQYPIEALYPPRDAVPSELSSQRQ